MTCTGNNENMKVLREQSWMALPQCHKPSLFKVTVTGSTPSVITALLWPFHVLEAMMARASGSTVSFTAQPHMIRPASLSPPACPLSAVPAILQDAPLVPLTTWQPLELLMRPSWIIVHRLLALSIKLG